MIYLSKTNRSVTEKYIKFCQQGLPNSKILEWHEILTKSDVDKLVFLGILRGTNVLYRWAEKYGKDFYFIDRPYWGESRNTPYYQRIVKNGHIKNKIEARPEDRFKKSFPWKIDPWNKNKKGDIVVCPPTNAIAAFFNKHSWLEETLEILKANTDRNIVVRNKGYNPIVSYNDDGALVVTGKQKNETNGPLDWNNVYTIVAFNSNITLEATARGIPIFCDSHNACAPIAEKDFSKIETPVYPDREPLYFSLAYGQFTAQEMRDGTAWRILDNGR